MIQIITFSFNRAMQLDTLLSSLVSHWKAPEYRIDVVYNYSTEDFGRAYEKLVRDYNGKPVKLHRESKKRADSYTFVDYLCLDNIMRLIRSPKLRHPRTDFRSIVIELLETTDADNVMFLTDDSMFISDIDIDSNVLNWINEKPTERQFSLRLGKGVSELPNTIKYNGDYCVWNMYENNGNWGYPFSVDAHIYNKSIILKLFKKYIFTNPNSLEANICSSIKKKNWFGESRCFTDIKMLTFPINIVQDVVDNVSQNVSVELLNKRYLNGEHMKYVMADKYNAEKQYVRQLEFISSDGTSSYAIINDKPVRE